MAARVNTKVVMIVLIAVFAAAVILGGLLFLQIRGSAERFVRIAEEKKQAALESKAAGEMQAYGDQLRKSKDFYARAVHKDPANKEYLRLMESTLLEIQPHTPDEAKELYGQWLGVMSHEITHFPADSELHLRLIHEVYRYGARSFNVFWQMIADRANYMYESVPASDPARNYALLYRGMAKLRSIALLESEEILQAEADLIEFLDREPDSDLGWATLILAQRSVALFLQREDRTLQGPDGIINDETMFARSEESMRQALEHVPDGPEVTRAALTLLAVQRENAPQTVDENELRATIDKLVALVRVEEEPGLVLEAAVVLRNLNFEDSPQLGIELLEGYLQRYPDALLHRLVLAQALYYHGDSAQAVVAAREILDAERLLVCFLAQYQRILSEQAALTIVDVRFSEWEIAQEERPRALELMQAAREELSSLVENPDNDRLLKTADGKLAYARGEYGKAASCFEWLIQNGQEGQIEPKTYIFAARCLRNIGQVGRAQTWLEKALEDPRNRTPFILLEKAAVEGEMRAFEQMRETVEEVLALEPENELAEQLMAQANRGLNESAQPSDPMLLGINEAIGAARNDDYATARTALNGLLEHNPDNLRVQINVLVALWQIETMAGNEEQARNYLDRALQFDPDNPRLVELNVMVNETDPIKRIRDYVLATTNDEVEQIVQLYFSFRMQAEGSRRLARQMEEIGDTERAEASRELAERADQEVASYLAQAMERNPDHPTLIEGRFQQALLDEDWALAEELMDDARDLNVDMANGLIYRGRYELHRQNFEAAIRALVQATDIKPWSGPAWGALALAYNSVGNYVDAERAFEQSYVNNPNDMNIVREFVTLLLQQEQKTRALFILQKASLVDPDDVMIHNLWLALEVDIGDKAVALKTRRQAYRDNPDDVSTAMRLAELLGKIEPSYELLLDVEGNPRYTLNSWNRLGPEVQEGRLLQERDRWNEEADGVIEKLIEAHGTTLALIRLQAELLRVRGEAERGEEIFRDFVDSLDESEITSQMLIQLALFHMQCFHVQQAFETMEKAREYQDPQRLEVDAVLAGMFFRAKQWTRALELYEGVIAVAPSTTAEFRAVECLIKLRRLDEAEQRLQETIREAGENYFSSMLRASILDGKADDLFAEGLEEQGEAKRRELNAALEQAKAFRPDLNIPYLLKANNLLKNYWRTAGSQDDRGLLEDALTELNDAEAIRASDPDIALTRADVLLAKRDRRGAIGALKKFLDVRPDYIMARKRMVELLQQEKRYQTAHTAIDEAMAFAEDLALWHEMKGDLYLDEVRLSPRMDPAEGDELKNKAVTAYQSAYSLRPNLAMLTKLADAALGVTSPNYKGMIERLEPMTAQLDLQPLLRVLYAKALSGDGQRERALEQMEQAYRTMKQRINLGEVPASVIAGWFLGLPTLFDRERIAEVEAFVMGLCDQKPSVHELHWLSVIYRDSGPTGFERAIEFAEDALEACPPDSPAMLAGLAQELGQCRLLVNDWAGAAEAFKTVLEIQPDNLVILNDYAFLRAQYMDDPAGALEYIERAVRLSPDNPGVLDSYGWILFKLGDLEKAQRNIQRALAGIATAEKHLHMAYVLAAQGQLADAEVELEKAGELHPDPKTQAEIEVLADDIRTRRGQGR